MTPQMDSVVSNTLEALKQKLIADISSLTHGSGDGRQESSAGMTTSVQDSAPTTNTRESCLQYSSDVADMQKRREINFPDYPVGGLVYDEDGKWYKSCGMGEILGGGADVSPRGLHIEYNAKRDSRMQHSVVLYHRDAFLKDGSTTNMTMSALTGGASGHDWRGTLVLMNRDRQDTRYSDITMRYLRIAVDYFYAYGDYTIREIEPGIGAHQLRNPGVLITCTGDQRELSKAPFVLVDVPHHHLIFHSTQGSPGIARRIGIPLRSIRQPPDPVWQHKHDENPDPYRNKAAIWLHTETDPKASWWAWSPLQWQDNVGGVLVVREDRKLITPRQVEMICAFATAMQPVFEDSTGAGRIERSKDEVLRLLTLEYFVAFFTLFRRSWADEDPSWNEEKCPD